MCECVKLLQEVTGSTAWTTYSCLNLTKLRSYRGRPISDSCF